MSYYANGSGTIAFKPGTDEDSINEIFDRYYDYRFDGSEVWFDKSVDRLVLDLTHHENYHEEDINDLLRRLTPFVEGGELNFIGEDNSMWRFHFDGEGFEEENGDVIFESDKARNDRFKTALQSLIAREEEVLGFASLYDLMQQIGLTDEDLKFLGHDYFIPENVVSDDSAVISVAEAQDSGTLFGDDNAELCVSVTNIMWVIDDDSLPKELLIPIRVFAKTGEEFVNISRDNLEDQISKYLFDRFGFDFEHFDFSF